MSRPGPRVHTFDVESRFLSYLSTEGGCVVWMGPRNSQGYGRFYATVSPGKRKYIVAHRYAWERENGTIPEGMHVDHTCWNKSCVNADHLRLATPSQNRAYLPGARSHNRTTGIRGVHPKGRGFRGSVQHNGVRHLSGVLPDIESATAWVETKRRELFGEFAGRG